MFQFWWFCDILRLQKTYFLSQSLNVGCLLFVVFFTSNWIEETVNKWLRNKSANDSFLETKRSLNRFVIALGWVLFGKSWGCTERNCRIFLSLRFYVKSKLAKNLLTVQICHLNKLTCCEFCILWILTLFEG